MRKTQEDISNALDRGNSTRDLFLNTAFGVIEGVVQKHAKEMHVGIQDQFCGNVLVNRIFKPYNRVAWQHHWGQIRIERVVAIDCT